MSGAKTTDYPAETTTEAVFETDESGNISAVLNKSSGVFHLSQDCYHAKRMKEENRQIIKAADIGDFIGKGYKPCGVCSAKYFDKEQLSLYLVKKVYLQAREEPLLGIARLCMEESVGKRISRERKGVDSIRKKAYEYLLDHELHQMTRSELGRLQIALMRNCLMGEQQQEQRLQERIDSLKELQQANTTMEIIRKIDECYNEWVDPKFETMHGSLEQVLAVTLEELTEYNWRDFLTEEMYEENFEAYLEQMSEQMTATGGVGSSDEQKKTFRRQVIRVSEEELKKVYTYVELNFGKTYLNPLEEKKLNYQLCRGVHGDCGL